MNYNSSASDHVRTNRGSRLQAEEDYLFSGEFWAGQRAIDLGLADDFGTVNSHLKATYGSKVKVNRVGQSGGLGGLFGANMMGASQPALAEQIVEILQNEELFAKYRIK